MKKILFLIHDLGPGGAEKVLVNLVNNMDRERFDITVMALFGGGVNERYLKDYIKYKAVFPRSVPGNSHIMKLFSPAMLHRRFIKEHFDVEIAYLEGPSARVISGCADPDTKLVSWIHSTTRSLKHAAASFRSVREAERCISAFHLVVGVAKTVLDAYLAAVPYNGKTCVLYNTNESERILCAAGEDVEPGVFADGGIRLISVGKLTANKGFDRLIRVLGRLRDEGYPVRLYLLGEGPDREKLRSLTVELGIENAVVFPGYQTNPYKYVSKCDLFVCSSHAEGFSTAATEALIVGTAVITTEVSGMREMLGNDEYGVITENNEEALYQGIKRLLDEPGLLAHYKEKAAERGRAFSTEETVRAVEDMLLEL